MGLGRLHDPRLAPLPIDGPRGGAGLQLVELVCTAGPPKARLEAITSRPLLLTGIAEKTRHARQERLTITPVHGKGDLAKALLTKVSAMLQTWQRNAEQLQSKTVWESVCDYFL